MLKGGASDLGYDDDPGSMQHASPSTRNGNVSSSGNGAAPPPLPRHLQPAPHSSEADHVDEEEGAPRQPSTMQRLLRCFAELDASLVLSVPRPDLIRAIVTQYGLSERQAKTVIVEKENELKEKLGSDGFSNRGFKRNGTVVYVPSDRRDNESQSSDGRSFQRQASPPASPAGFSWSPRSSSPPDSSEHGFAAQNQKPSNQPSFTPSASTSSSGSTFKSLSIKKHDLIRDLGSSSSAARRQSMEDILIDPISMELMKKPVMLPCGHSFSRRTITKWLEQQNKCPSCNTPATVGDLQPNYALRTVVRHYKKMAKQDRLGKQVHKLASSSSTSDGERRKKKSKGKMTKETKGKKKKESSALPAEMEADLSPFAFFNAWVNGKDKKAKEERQARQRGEDDGENEIEDESEGIIFAPSSADSALQNAHPSTAVLSELSSVDVIPSAPLTELQAAPQHQAGSAWVGDFVPSAFPNAAQPSATLMGDDLMVGYAAGVSDEDMGRVSFSSSLFTFDESPKGTRRERARPVDEDEDERTQDDDDDEEDDEEEEEEVEDEEVESSSDEDEDDADIHAGSWPSKSETIVIGGKIEEPERIPRKKEAYAQTNTSGLIARFKALTSSSEKSEDSKEKHQKTKSSGKSEAREPEEEEEPENLELEANLARPKTQKNAPRDDPEAEADLPVKEQTGEKLRLALDVEYQHLRYDMQHRNTLVAVSVRAPPAPNSLRNLPTPALQRDKPAPALGVPVSHVPAVALNKRTEQSALGTTESVDAAVPIIGSSERAQVAVIAAIDRSSSMKGQKMTLVKESLQFLISQLSPGDCMGLVSYDEDVCTEIPLTFLDDAGKESVRKAVSNIRTGLWTNLSGGLFSALQLLNKLPSAHSSMVCSILLFTDGGANRGITQTDQIVNALDAELRQLRSRSLAPTVFTFGFGSAPDANMLTKIAEMGNGLYYAIEAAEAIPAAFADCLGGLLSVCAENIRVKIEVVGEATINKIFGNQSVEEHSPHKSYSLLLGDIYYEEARDILLGLTLPALDGPASSVPILSATLTYSSLPSGRHTTISSECSVSRPATSAITADTVHPSYEVDKQRNRVSTAEAIKRAITEQEGQRFDSAVAILMDAINQIQNSASAMDPFCLSLVENLNECIIRTKRAKESGGGNKVSYQSSLALAHSRQRSTHVSSTLTYSTTSKASTTLKFKPVSKSVPATSPSSAQKAPRSHGDIKFLLANTKQLFERIRLIYALVEDHCSERSCPKMTAGPKFEYLWKDERYKQPTPLPAPQYVSLLFQATEQVFTHAPSLAKIKDSLRRLFRVYAHIYHHHIAFFDEIAELKLLETSFASFVRFVREHGLIDERELLPMHLHPEVKS